MRFRCLPAALTSLAVASALVAPAPAGAVDIPRADDSVRNGHRGDVQIPEGAIVTEIARRSAATTFSAEVDAIVAKLDLATYDGYLKDLSGWNSVVVGGSSTTFQTRHSTTVAGQVCWQYAYEQLQALGYQVRYQNYTRSGNNLKNVIATIPGQTTPDQIYVIGAHIDATSQNPSVIAKGAEDNASGSAAVLMAAAALVGESFDSTIELILFSGEEQGLWGSDHYVSDAIANNINVQSAVTMDMISAFNSNYGVLIEGETAWQPLMTIMADAVDNYTSINRQYSYFSFGSDHVPFQNANIPAILAIDLDWGSYAPYHSTTDTYDKTTPALGLEIAKAAIASLVHQAGALPQANDAPVPALPRSLRAFPNPASQSVTVSFLLERDARMGPVRVYDVRGREVSSVRLRDLGPVTPELDMGEAVWDLRNARGRTVKPGIYWLRHGEEARKVVVTP